MVQVLGLRYTRIIYVESFARVKSLSLSGKLVRRFVDMFLVQWPDAAGVGFAQIIRDTDTGDGQPGMDPAGDGELGEWDRGRGRGKGQVQYRGWLV